MSVGCGGTVTVSCVCGLWESAMSVSCDSTVGVSYMSVGCGGLCESAMSVGCDGTVGVSYVCEL